MHSHREGITCVIALELSDVAAGPEALDKDILKSCMQGSGVTVKQAASRLISRELNNCLSYVALIEITWFSKI
jgi:hypothetical protein